MENRKPRVISVGELAKIVQGEIIICPEQSEELVENLMVGAMCVDPAPLYFGTKSNKAVITRGDRVDIQIGALETSTKCLILTGGTKPHPNVVSLAKEKKVAVILAENDTQMTLSQLEQGIQ